MTGDAWVFPIGHYLGPFFPGQGAPMDSHRIRVGQSLTQLFAEEEFAVWAFAHGLPDRTGPWTRQEIEAAVQESGDTGTAAGVIDDLIESGALAEVTAGTAAAVAFARSHRFEALLCGLGESDEQPDAFHLGLIGQPLATVDELAFDIWQWAPLRASVWATCEALATVDAIMSGGQADPEAMLAPVLRRIHTLLSHGAAYLDLAVPTGPEPG
jgi:hypothetical protein